MTGSSTDILLIEQLVRIATALEKLVANGVKRAVQDMCACSHTHDSHHKDYYCEAPGCFCTKYVKS